MMADDEEEEIKTVIIPGFNQEIVACVTHNPTTVTQWITNVDAYFTLRSIHPEHEPKILSLAVSPENPTRPAILQILVDRSCLIFKLAHASRIPESLKQFLANRVYTFVGVGVEWALEKLGKYYRIGGNTTRCLELSSDYGLYGVKGEQPRKFTLKDLCRTKLSMEMDEKPIEVLESDWGNEDLSAEQVKFSCLDGFVAYQVAMSMSLSAACICEALLVLLGRGPPP